MKKLTPSNLLPHTMLYLILLLLCGYSEAYSRGAPTSACGSMKPGHASQSQTSASPYKVTVSGSTVSTGGQLTVELNPTGSETFKGFFLQARNSDDDIIGSFETVTNDGKYVNCGNKPQTAVTHVNSNPKSSVKVKWTAPSDFEGSVKIHATIVQDYSTFWVKVQSNSIEVVENEVEVEENDEAEESDEGEENLDEVGETVDKVVENNGTRQIFCDLILFYVIICNFIH